MVKLFRGSTAHSSIKPDQVIPFCVKNEYNEIVHLSQKWKEEFEQHTAHILNTPLYDFVEINGQVFQKTEYVQNGHTYTCIIPAHDYYQALIDKENLTQKVKDLEQKIKTFIEKSPFPLCIIDENIYKLVFANRLLLELFNVSLSKFYNGVYFSDIVPEAVFENIITLVKRQNEVKSYIFNIEIAEKQLWLMFNAYSFSLDTLKGYICSFIDITSEKEKEIHLQELKVEIETQNEELKQNNEILHDLYQKLEISYQDVQQGLRSGQRTQKLVSRPLRLSNHLPKQNYFHILKPHSYVSGDFYWSKQKDGYLYLVVGDATGHGVSGGLLAMTFVTMLSQFFSEIQSPDQIHQLLNLIHQNYTQELISNETDVNVEGADMTLVAFPLQNTDHFFYTCAHSKILFYNDTENHSVVLEGQKYPVGFYVKDYQQEPYQSYRVECISKNSKIFLFTDGIKDMVNAQNQKYSLKRLKSFMDIHAAKPMREIQELLLQEIENFQYGEQNDDIQIVGIELSY